MLSNCIRTNPIGVFYNNLSILIVDFSNYSNMSILREFRGIHNYYTSYRWSETVYFRFLLRYWISEESWLSYFIVYELSATSSICSIFYNGCFCCNIRRCNWSIRCIRSACNICRCLNVPLIISIKVSSLCDFISWWICKLCRLELRRCSLIFEFIHCLHLSDDFCRSFTGVDQMINCI